MTATAEAWLDDVVAHPKDDSPRLIFADWLEERGEQARAEFIRVQCELARMEDPWCKAEAREDNCEELGLLPLCGWCSLRRRERELLRAHWRLAGDVDPFGSIAAVTDPPGRGRAPAFTAAFRRGFVAEVTCRLEDWCGGPCGRCGGELSIRIGFGGRHGYGGAWCRACRGTGRAPGHGPALVRATPLERVTLSDREPWDRHVSGRWWWVAEGTSPFTGYRVPESCLLPTDLMSRLPAEGFPRGYGLTAWRTSGGRGSRQAALDAASAALLDWAKSAVP